MSKIMNYIKQNPISFVLIISFLICVVLFIIGFFVEASNYRNVSSIDTSCSLNAKNMIQSISIGNNSTDDDSGCITGGGEQAIPIYLSSNSPSNSIYATPEGSLNNPPTTTTGICLNTSQYIDDVSSYSDQVCGSDLIAIDAKLQQGSSFPDNSTKCAIPSSTPTSSWTYADSDSLATSISGNFCPYIDYSVCQPSSCTPTWLCVEYDSLNEIQKREGSPSSKYLNINRLYINSTKNNDDDIQDDYNIVKGCPASISNTGKEAYLYKNYIKYNSNTIY